jgi:hypothetical protein
MLLEQARYIKNNPSVCQTYVIDTADWAEKLCIAHICANRLPPKGKDVINGIEDFGYGKGYTYLEEEFGRLLNLLEEVVEVGVNVVFTAHAQMRKFEQPDEMGAYDRWELKLEKKTAPLVKEWADTVLFANYKTYVVNVDNQGTSKGKNKAQGGKRVMHTTHHPCWDAKNRDDLPEEVEFSFASIAHCITASPVSNHELVKEATKSQEPIPESKPEPKQNNAPADTSKSSVDELAGVPRALADLMRENDVTVLEIQRAVSQKGYYPESTLIEKYDPDFINGVLVGAWLQVFSMIKELRELPL